MVADRASFEVQVSKDGRWATETIVYKEDEARALAKKLLADKKCEGAKIVRNWLRGDGTMVESEIFCETRTVKDDGPIRIVPIDSIPDEKCETPDDFMGDGARNVVNRVFRNYLDKQFLTPTELMHSYKELKRLQEKDSLVPSAVDRVAQLQTKDGEQDAKSRGQEIFKSIDDISARARRVESLKLPKLDGSFSEMMAKIAAMGESEDRDYLAMVVLSRDLMNVRNWVGKLERLCNLAVADSDPHALEMLDGVIADVLGSNVVQDVLGWQPGLGAAIIAMFDLAAGKMKVQKSDAGESAEVLNRLFAENKLPVSRAGLLDRAHRQIRSPNPLNRTEPEKEGEEFKRLMMRTLTPTGFASGAETAEALTTRFTRLVEQGGSAGRKAAMESLFRTLPDRAFGLIYLCDMLTTPYGEEHAATISELLGFVFRSRALAEFCDRTLPPKDRMMRATNAHRAAMASQFPAETKTQLAEHIDGILERYLIDEQIVEKLDHHESPLRDRAVRLVQFCAAGVLPEGKAMTRARQRILGLLRMPNFDAHFIDGFTDPMRAQKALRDFHQLLVKAGFG
ncbi:hypothetical protein CU669_04435 [Paramagnetospirillum kuznetsovii]|uniref:Uncharacterized protein n=1 Tax=Paramagnetospirillum kuznetsovii TaxID=2053833 RepID=A0A364P233_9PROT|nr:hypothetical protein [Paramagnetospirillum kuznetsovii]RAU23384.1 hypothetical protein CU669_04435 [Paramagnetospirillum kuznetsovii]